MVYRKKFDLLTAGGLAVFTIFSLCTLSSVARCDEVEDAIESLKLAEPFQRGAKAMELAEGNAMLVPKLTEIVEEHEKYEDQHFIVSCIAVIAELGSEARDATDALLNSLQTPARQLSYSAARALGFLWEGEGGEEENADTVRIINTALLSHVISAKGAEVYGPGISLARINNDVFELSAKESLEPDPLRERLFSWFLEEGTARLTEMQDWNWQLLLKTYLQEPDSERGISAKEMVAELSPLGAVDYLVNQLEQSRPDDDSWVLMADKLEAITGVEIDIESAREEYEPRAFLTEWQVRWFDSLKDLTQQQHKQYAWNRLENAVREAKYEAYPESFVILNAITETVIYQYNSKEEIPTGASDTARNLVEESLELKQQFKSIVEELLDAVALQERLDSIENIRILTEQEAGIEIGMVFLDDIIAAAVREENELVLSGIERVLTNIGRIPVRLDTDPETREQTLVQWEESVRARSTLTPF